MPQMPQSVPLDPVPYSDSPPGLSRAPERSRGVGVGGSGANTSGGGAIRTVYNIITGSSLLLSLNWKMVVL